MPDELPIAISMILNKMKPHRDIFKPIYWEHYEKRHLSPPELYHEFWGYSGGGSVNSSSVKKIYNDLAQNYCRRFGVQHLPLQDKRRFLPKRSNI
jgi:hypothetical protein